jgi:hypothetical protein
MPIAERRDGGLLAADYLVVRGLARHVLSMKSIASSSLSKSGPSSGSRSDRNLSLQSRFENLQTNHNSTWCKSVSLALSHTFLKITSCSGKTLALSFSSRNDSMVGTRGNPTYFPASLAFALVKWYGSSSHTFALFKWCGSSSSAPVSSPQSSSAAPWPSPSSAASLAASLRPVLRLPAPRDP